MSFKSGVSSIFLQYFVIKFAETFCNTKKEDGTFDRDIRYGDSDALNIIHDKK